MRKLYWKLLTLFLCMLLSISLTPVPTFAAVPSAPTGLTATARATNQIDLTWNSASGATSYYIYRSTSYYGDYSYIGSQTYLGYIDASLSSNTTYYYKVRAVNSDGSSDYSSVAYATTQSSSSNLTATASGYNQIYLTWPSISGTSYYILSRSTSYSGSYSTVTVTPSTSYTDTGLSSGTTYYYKVEAINSSGSYIYYSNITNATANSSSSSGNLTATSSGSNQIYLSWPTISGTTYYILSRSTSYSGSYSTVTITPSTGYTDTGLSTGTTYYYKVEAINSSGSYIYTSNIANATAGSSSTSDLTATNNGSGQIYLSWPSISGTSYYILSRSTSYSGTYSTVAATSSTSYTDTGLSTGTTYYYKVEGINSSGSTIYYSSIVSANTSSSSDLTATATGSSQINLSWPAISGTSYYIVTRSTSYSGTYSTITTTSSTAYNDTGLSAGVTYYYKIQAVNSSGSTIYYSSIASATASSSSSSADLSATASGSGQIYLSWPVVSGTSYYYVSRSTSYYGTYSNIGTTAYTSYSDSGLSSGTAYYYKIQAVNSSGSYIYTSSIASATTLSGTSAQITSDRLAGDNRYETSREIARFGWSSSYYAVIVSGENYPDALCSAPLAAKYNAPILLTSKYSLDTLTRDELTRLNVRSVFLIGGLNTISSTVEQTIQNMGISVTRIAGTDRYDTSLKIAQTIGESGQAVVANGETFADALSIAPIAAIKKMPIILTPKNTLSSSLRSYLQNSVQSTYVIGGTGAVSNTVYNQLPSPQRISGTNRYETNVNIIKNFSSQLDLTTCYLATGQTYPDALAGSAVASLKKAPIVLVNNSLDQVTKNFIQERTGIISKVVAFGGTSVVPNTVITTISGTSNSTLLSAPTNFTASSLSASQIYLTWSTVSGANNYYIYRATSYSGTYSYLTSVTSTSYTDSGLSANTTYYYKVVALNSSGQSAYSSIASATTTNNGYPSVPTGLTATPSGADQIYLSWNSSSSASYYYLYRSTSYSGTYTLVTSTNSTSYTDSGLSIYTTYYYKVMAVNSLGSSDYSSIVNATTSTVSYPTAPINLSISSVNSSQLRISWDSVSSASTYYIYRSSSSSGSYTSVGSSSTTAYTDTGLDPNTTYYYKVMAYNSYGYSPYSSVIFGTTALAAPTNLSATAISSSQINLTWTGVSGATNYIVSRSSTVDGTYSSIATVSTNSYSNTGLTAGTTYYYKVQTLNSVGASSYSAVANATTQAGSVPAVPTNLDANPVTGSSQIMLTWTAASGATSYTVTRCETVDGTYTNIATGVNTAYHLDSTASPNTVYYYKIVAVNSAGSSAPSAEDHAKSAPAAPTGLAATAAGADIALNWTGSAGAVSYKVWRSATADGTFTEIAPNVLDTTYTDAGLAAGSTFYYKVQAVNDEAKTGSLTSAVSGTTAPPAPTGLTATATSSTIQLGWSSAAGATSYTIKKFNADSGVFVVIAENVTATNYTDSGLNAATTYRYKVQAENAAGLSPESEEKQATTLAE